MAGRDALEQCIGFDWDDTNAQKNWDRHHVTPQEAEDVFFNEPLIVEPLIVRGDPRHSGTERRYYALGRRSRERPLFVAFMIRRKLIRVISVRDMNRSEAETYRRHEKNAT